MLLIVLVILAILFMGGGYYGRTNGPAFMYGGPGIGVILIIVLIVMLLGGRL